MPDTIRHHYTEGERSALAVIAGEVKHHGICDLPLDKIAALAGVSRTTVQNAIREARALKHLSVELRERKGQKNLTNIVRITSDEWKVWLKRGPSPAREIGFKILHPTKNQDKTISYEKRERAARAVIVCRLEGAWERERAARHMPNTTGEGAAMADWPYNTTAWRKLRQLKLKASPLCHHCKLRGQLVVANTVDHNTPVSKGGEPFPALDELTSLCSPCHNAKTATHDRGNAKPFARRVPGFDVNGNPVDPDDDWHGGGASDHQQ